MAAPQQQQQQPPQGSGVLTIFSKDAVLDWAIGGGMFGAMFGATQALVRVTSPLKAAIVCAAEFSVAGPAYYAIRTRLEEKREKGDIYNPLVSGCTVGWFLGGYNATKLTRGIRGSLLGSTIVGSIAVMQHLVFQKMERDGFEVNLPVLSYSIEFPSWFPIQKMTPEEIQMAEIREKERRRAGYMQPQDSTDDDSSSS
eukprot:jgi/Bigna1/86452/estExt_fgenesh1_pg.C_100279